MQIIHRVGADLPLTESLLKGKQVQPRHFRARCLADPALGVQSTGKLQPHLRLGHMPKRSGVREIQSQDHGQRIRSVPLAEKHFVITQRIGIPINRSLGVKLGYIGTRTYAKTGSDTDTPTCAFSFSW